MNTEDVLLDLHNRMTRAMNGYSDSSEDGETSALDHVKATARAEGVALCRAYVEQAIMAAKQRERTW